MVLADTAFGSVEFLHEIRQPNIMRHGCNDRLLVDGRCLKHLHKRGQQVRLVGLKFPVSVSWYYLKVSWTGKTICSVYQTPQKGLHGGKTEMADRLV